MGDLWGMVYYTFLFAKPNLGEIMSGEGFYLLLASRKLERYPNLFG